MFLCFSGHCSEVNMCLLQPSAEVWCGPPVCPLPCAGTSMGGFSSLLWLGVVFQQPCYWGTKHQRSEQTTEPLWVKVLFPMCFQALMMKADAGTVPDWGLKGILWSAKSSEDTWFIHFYVWSWGRFLQLQVSQALVLLWVWAADNKLFGLHR